MDDAAAPDAATGARRGELLVSASVAAGGALGASARWAVGELLPGFDDDASAGLPWATLAVNVVGCLLVGISAARLGDDHPARPFVVTGVLGGFTTMSALAVELNDVADAGRLPIAVLYLGVTLVAGLVAVLAGQRWAEHIGATT